MSHDRTVRFPMASEARAITRGPREHLFASYYGINSWDSTQRYATVLETDVKHRLPTEEDVAALALVDHETDSLIPLTETRAWNLQQGCMAHWLATAPDRQIIYNDLRNDRFVSIIRDVFTDEEHTVPHPVSAVSPNGKEAVCINFARIRITRTDYGYGGEGQDAQGDVPFPDDDGLFLLNLETGQTELLVSIAAIEDMVPEVAEGGIEYFNHTLFSRDGSKIFWLARAIPERNTVAFTVNRDGTDLRRCYPDDWGGSHFDWLDGDQLMITASYKASMYSHVLFTVGQQDYRRLGNTLLDYDGHGTFSPDGQWMVTDAYPNALREQRLYLMHMDTQAVIALGSYVEPREFSGYWRCDLHPRWSPNGDLLGINSTHTGSRQAYVIRLED